MTRTGPGASFEYQFHDHGIHRLIIRLGAILPVEMADEAAEISGDGPRDLHYALAYASMIDRLRFRRDMHREFADEPDQERGDRPRADPGARRRDLAVLRRHAEEQFAEELEALAKEDTRPSPRDGGSRRGA